MKFKSFLNLNNLKKINKDFSRGKTLVREYFHKDHCYQNNPKNTLSTLVTLRKELIDYNGLYLDRIFDNLDFMDIYLKTDIYNNLQSNKEYNYFFEFINKNGKKIKIAELNTKTLMDHFIIPDKKANFINNLKENPDTDIKYREKSLLYFKDFIDSLDFSQRMEDRELIIFNKVKVLKFFKYTHRFRLDLDYIDKGNGFIEFGSKEDDIDSRLFSKYKLIDKPKIETSSLGKIGSEDEGSFIYTKKFEILKEQEDYVKKFIDSYKSKKN